MGEEDQEATPPPAVDSGDKLTPSESANETTTSEPTEADSPASAESPQDEPQPAASAPAEPKTAESSSEPPEPSDATPESSEPEKYTPSSEPSVPATVVDEVAPESSTQQNIGTDTKNTVFPCIEQPLRVTLHCNGYYLWGLKNGRVIARKKRSSKDEFRLKYKNDGALVEIVNHKFRGTLSVMVGEDDNSRKVVCVKDEDEEEEKKKESNDESKNDNNATTNGTSATEADPDEEEEDFQDEPAISNSEISEIDRQWCFVKGTHGRNEVLLKSLRTGENLGVDTNGNIVFAASDNPDDDPTKTITWDIECVTGELCFISNPTLDTRIRCDMAGLMSLTDSWKGWEVFRLMEASHGYVKISSWMHSQWLLCSNADGTVSTCSHAESFLENNSKGCPKWAIEKAPDNGGDGPKGVIIRNKTHGRLLSVHEGFLKTYDPAESIPEMFGNSATSSAVQQPTTEDSGNGAKKWWNSSVKTMNNNMRNSVKSMQKRFSSASVKTESGEQIFLPQKDTTVWQLEAAHSQTYYLLSAVEGEPPRSIGQFPEVTANLRQTDKIQLVREETGITKLFLTEKKQFISCNADGNIDLVNSAEDLSVEWIMEKPSYQEGGSVFRSKHHNLYLSYEDTAKDVENEGENDNADGHFSKLFGGNKENVGLLVGIETMGEREIWRLEPCMPRAVSSEKLKTFALGTSIAVGTTIAMPFALAGVGAVLGAVGAEVGVVANVIFAGLTGAEALASVGAIGATAYICFRPEENSLTDDHKNDEEEAAERAWSKRPFSNWRNW
ncbi:expressed unknown protein [Seminavis robusta]|uniref:Uncharacterized protein n=1 Tax=Seminavis robusta TaxID=568900 RepID=A0A9N8DYM5_9STRA|nr:expressed unknown protein [Seminavis robusta]|eukprot:Sro372_g128900.1 n/a (782) ;mRNA; r:63666-66178